MRALIICLFLAISTAAVYWPVGNFDFVNYDDEGYVYANPRVLTGITGDNLRWALTATELANYHPLTWISYQLDASLFGANPRAFHLVNVAFHIANVVLLFLLLLQMTASATPAALVSAVFALHPLHVESVAWISERKDVLSTFFFLLASIAYVAYTRRSEPWRRRLSYAAVVVLFALGLLAKPMIVTFPFVLLLLDYWPLRRPWNRWRVIEKLLLLLLSALSCWVTVRVQEAGGAIMTLDALPLTQRLANAAVGYLRYLGKVVWPARLSIFYPQTRAWPIALLIGAVVTLVVVTIICVRRRRSAPYLIVGWLLFLGTLVPVIGLVQVGWQSIADRYMYLPLIGPAVMVVWSFHALVQPAERSRRTIASIGAAAALIALAAVTVRQLQFWRNTRALFEHALAVTDQNAIAHVQLGYLEAHQGDPTEARRHYEEAIGIDPTYYVSEYNLANLLLRDRPDLAVQHYRRAATNRAGVPRIENNLGVALLASGQPQEAAGHFRAAIGLDPTFLDPRSNLGFLHLNNGATDAAEAEFNAALSIDPSYERAKRGLERARAARMGTTTNPAR